MTFLQNVLAFLLALGPLILFHELGHYTVARLCGVKVLRFSIGMGKVVWSRRFGPDQTEWAISILPLGGYVKMLDNRDPATAAKTEAEAEREFTRQSVWRRIAIVAAGPIANFLLAIALFAGLYMYGVPDVSTRLRFMPETAAIYQVGVRGGDRIMAVNGEAVATWSELRFEVLKAVLDKSDMQLDVAQPGGARFHATVPASALATLNVESDILGTLGFAAQRSPAVIGKVLDGGAAQRAGLQAGDAIASIDAKPIRDGIEMIQVIRAAAGRTLDVALVRAGQPLQLVLKPDTDGATKQGVIKAEVQSVPEMVTVPAGLLGAVAKATRTTWDQSVMQVKMIGQMIVGKLSWKNVTGPITIGDYAGQTARSGVVVFLGFIAMISISLGVMNLLPIPVLDGGHLLYYSLEVLTGRPLPERIGDYAQRAGVGLLVMLMALAVFNDVARLL
jgi:regulator of sigma E protease